MRTHIEYDDFGEYEESMEDLLFWRKLPGNCAGNERIREPELLKIRSSLVKLCFRTDAADS